MWAGLLWYSTSVTGRRPRPPLSRLRLHWPTTSVSLFKQRLALTPSCPLPCHPVPRLAFKPCPRVPGVAPTPHPSCQPPTRQRGSDTVISAAASRSAASIHTQLNTRRVNWTSKVREWEANASLWARCGEGGQGRGRSDSYWPNTLSRSVWSKKKKKKRRRRKCRF